MPVFATFLSALLALAVPAQAPASQAERPQPAQDQAATLAAQVFVMRHLQAGSGEDPGLSEAGAAQARQLFGFFESNPPRTIFASRYRRAQETAAPLAAALGIELRTYDPARPADLIAALAAAPGPVLIVGHSNTVPDLVERLGGERPGEIDHGRFGDVWTVHLDRRTEHRRLP